jgi:hypothetical protein
MGSSQENVSLQATLAVAIGQMKGLHAMRTYDEMIEWVCCTDVWKH